VKLDDVVRNINYVTQLLGILFSRLMLGHQLAISPTSPFKIVVRDYPLS